MFVLVLVMASLGQCLNGGCSTGGGGQPQMPIFFPAPQVQLQPPIQDGIASGKLVVVEIEHSNGQRWRYSFAKPPEVAVTLDANTNATAVENVAERLARLAKAAEQPPIKPCPNKKCICSPPCCCADCKCKDIEPEAKPIPNFGMDKDWLNRTRNDANRYSTNGGKQITKKDCDRLLKGGGTLPDDALYDSLTIIGTPDECNRVKADIEANPAFAPLKDKLLVQYFQPQDEMVKDKGFQPGTPSVYLQDSTGKVKWREPSYRGPKELATEINKRRPDYDPNKDPGPNNPGPIKPAPDGGGWNIDLKQVPWWGWVLAAMFMLSSFRAPVK